MNMDISLVVYEDPLVKVIELEDGKFKAEIQFGHWTMSRDINETYTLQMRDKYRTILEEVANGCRIDDKYVDPILLAISDSVKEDIEYWFKQKFDDSVYKCYMLGGGGGTDAFDAATLIKMISTGMIFRFMRGEKIAFKGFA